MYLKVKPAFHACHFMGPLYDRNSYIHSHLEGPGNDTDYIFHLLPGNILMRMNQEEIKDMVLRRWKKIPDPMEIQLEFGAYLVSCKNLNKSVFYNICLNFSGVQKRRKN